MEAKFLLAYFKARRIGYWRGLALDLGDFFNNPTAYPASALFLVLYFYGRDYPEVDPKEICEII